MRSADAIISTAVQAAKEDTAVLRFADVTAVVAGKLTVTLDGVSIAGIPVMASYASPTAGDRAWIIKQGSVLVAIGKG